MTKKAFTLLELLLVIAIVAVLSGLVIFAVRPAEILTDTNKAKEKFRSSDIEKAIEAYVLENNGALPFSTSGLAETAYSICTYGQSTNCGINLDTLVSSGYLNSIPTSPDTSGNMTGYMLKYSSKGVSIGSSDIRCPQGYVTVPGSSLYNTDDFCVMKYEAKNVSAVATSQAALTPWNNVSQTSAITACSNLGSGYHLITNNEWMTIARNLEQVSTNWVGGVIGTNKLYIGHMELTPALYLDASTDDNDGYYGTGNADPSDQRRTMTLSNGDVIWDFSGNAQEMTSDVLACAAANCTSAEMPFDASPATEWVEFINLAGYGQFSYNAIRPSNATWDYTYGIGKLFSDFDAATSSGNNHIIIRGGSRLSTAASGGIFSMDFSYSQAYTSAFNGFRCALNL